MKCIFHLHAGQIYACMCLKKACSASPYFLHPVSKVDAHIKHYK